MATGGHVTQIWPIRHIGTSARGQGDRISGRDFSSLNKRKEASKGTPSGPTDCSLLPASVCGYVWPGYLKLWKPSCDREVI